jgi:hypothetical protein
MPAGGRRKKGFRKARFAIGHVKWLPRKLLIFNTLRQCGSCGSYFVWAGSSRDWRRLTRTYATLDQRLFREPQICPTYCFHFIFTVAAGGGRNSKENTWSRVCRSVDQVGVLNGGRESGTLRSVFLHRSYATAAGYADHIAQEVWGVPKKKWRRFGRGHFSG